MYRQDKEYMAEVRTFDPASQTSKIKGNSPPYSFQPFRAFHSR